MHKQFVSVCITRAQPTMSMIHDGCCSLPRCPGNLCYSILMMHQHQSSAPRPTIADGAAMYLLIGKPMLPYGRGWSVFLLWVCAHIGGFLAAQVRSSPPHTHPECGSALSAWQVFSSLVCVHVGSHLTAQVCSDVPQKQRQRSRVQAHCKCSVV